LGNESGIPGGLGGHPEKMTRGALAYPLPAFSLGLCGSRQQTIRSPKTALC